MIEKLLAGIGLAMCVLLLLAMLLGEKRRRRWADKAKRLMGWRRRRARARREAQETIARVRRNVERNGNVYRPRSFNGHSPDEPPEP